jgi:heat shock protein HslJ
MDAAMPNRRPRLQHFLLAGVLAAAALLLPIGDSLGAPAMAVYRGEAPAASGPGRRIELRLKADGSMAWLTDYRNNRAPIIEEGRWNPLTVEEFDVIIEMRDGKPVTPEVVRFTKQGDTLRSVDPGRFGSQGLQLRQFKAAVPVAAAPVVQASSPIGVWNWEGQVAADDRLQVDQPDRYTLELQSGGKALVRADCNRGQAAYKLDGRSISIRLGAMTRAACPPGSLSDRFLKALETAVGQRTRGDSLFLDLPAEGGSLKFVRAKN